MTLSIGIDPGTARNVGLAMIDERERIHAITTTNRVALYRTLSDIASDIVAVYVEDPRMIPTVYARNRRGASPAGLRIARNVGMNQHAAQVIIEDLEAFGFKVVPVKPSGAKWTAETVRALGYAGRTSQHGRDALRCVMQGVRMAKIGGAA